ncbi:predicted acetyltransferase of 30S ribosomal protein L7 [Mesoplasma florum L1]|uniref:Predicted acetyltransferase of 30S ribosomal protein L7 n=1 Tax=Mesoplasma florum (strain ATCC 33453 / NBRC 100688 / NCTC 11704 / L1) TaxID=265311 RepID=Q6F0H0_MESFL|nr:GNAT family N-acetyltransferase [Mesoplasma florum]AAT76003.1 predicted acetyltransferase of 30S ribosomal protein L7 [Mesoplasma florum L1]
MKLKVVKPQWEHIEEILNALEDFKKYPNEIKENIQGSSDILSFERIEDWLEFVHEGVGNAGWMPFNQYLALDEENKVIGFINLRLKLNEYLLNFGGHIGYGVVPSRRKQGYATEMLKQTLKIAKKEGINEILITCLDSNIASEKVILNNGGIYEDSRINGDKTIKRFWIK